VTPSEPAATALAPAPQVPVTVAPEPAPAALPPAATAPPATPEPQPAAAPPRTIPATPAPVAVAPPGAQTPPVTQSPPLTAPAAPAATTPAKGPAATVPVPADFPSPTAPAPDSKLPVTPVIPPTTPPTAPPPAAVTTPPEPAPPPASKIPLLTLLLTPADGRTPLLVSNQNYLFIGGKIAPGSDVVTVRVNGLDANIRNGEYQTQVNFPGPGEYLLLVEAIDRQGGRTSHRRTIRVLEGLDALAPEPLGLSMRGGSVILALAPGTRVASSANVKRTLEIRNAEGQLVHNWVLEGDQLSEITWNGANASGKPLPVGKYEIVYILSGQHGPLAWIRQPLELKE
jgi:hypothetical protein